MSGTALTATQLVQMGTALQAASSVAGGVASFATAQNNASAARTQAKIEANALLRDRRIQMARARAMVGASGASFTGTPIELLASEAGRAVDDAIKIEQLGEIRADLFETQGMFGLSKGFLGATGAILEGEIGAERIAQEERLNRDILSRANLSPDSRPEFNE